MLIHIMGFAASIYRYCFLKPEISREDYPNLDQSTLAKEDKWKKVICAPAAETNVVRHLHLAPDDSDAVVSQEFIKDMGTRDQESDNPGTETEELITGIQKYFKDHNKKVKALKWRGWGAGETERKGSKYVPKFNWIAKSMTKKQNEVTLQIGYYKKNSDGNYERLSGHFVACTGYEKKSMNLKIDDSAPRASRKEQHLVTEELKSGKLIRGDKTNPAKGYNVLKDMALPEGADIAVVDGALSYKLV